MQTSILKCGERYVFPRNFGSLKLEKYKSTARKSVSSGVSVGISTANYGKEWFHLPEGKVIFKDFQGYDDHIREFRIVNELLVNKICKQLGIECAEYQLATYNNINGLVSYNVAKPEEEVIAMADLASNLGMVIKNKFSFMKALLERAESKGYKFDRGKILVGVYQMMVLDFLTMQSDRHYFNIHFIVNESEKTLSLSPLIDNEYAFAGRIMGGHLRDNALNASFTQREFLDEYMGISEMHKASFIINSYQEQANELIWIASRNDKFKAVLDNCLENYDVNKCIKQLEDEGVKISDDYKHWVNMISDISSQTIKNTTDESEVGLEFYY